VDRVKQAMAGERERLGAPDSSAPPRDVSPSSPRPAHSNRPLAPPAAVEPVDMDISMAMPDDGKIAFSPVFEDRWVSIGLFYLGRGATLPLHNHPGMTVFSRLLVGSLKQRSYDWVSQAFYEEARPRSRPTLAVLGAPARTPARGPRRCPPPTRPSPQPVAPGKTRPARLVQNVTVAAPATCVLHPTRGNIHALAALEPAVFLDVLAPPYRSQDRECTYYREIPLQQGKGAGPSGVTEDAITAGVGRMAVGTGSPGRGAAVAPLRARLARAEGSADGSGGLTARAGGGSRSAESSGRHHWEGGGAGGQQGPQQKRRRSGEGGGAGGSCGEHSGGPGPGTEESPGPLARGAPGGTRAPFAASTPLGSVSEWGPVVGLQSVPKEVPMAHLPYTGARVSPREQGVGGR